MRISSCHYYGSVRYINIYIKTYLNCYDKLIPIVYKLYKKFGSNIFFVTECLDKSNFLAVNEIKAIT